MHCLDVLRESVLCHADDTPMYVGHVNANTVMDEAPAGIGQTRMCRSWDSLMAYANSHSACYNPHANSSDSELDRYKYCPDGSRPWEQA